MQQNICQASYFGQPLSLPDAFPSTYRSLFNAAQKVFESSDIKIKHIEAFFSQSYPELKNEASVCTSYNQVFHLLYTYSSLMNIIYLHEILKHFKLCQKITSEMNSHDTNIKGFCDRVTVQQASQEKYCFMPDCNRRFLIQDTVEFRLDLEYQHNNLSDVLRLIEEAFPQLSCYVQLRCVYIETHAVSVKCFAPCNSLQLALLSQTNMTSFLEKHRNVISISIGGVAIAEQESESKELIKALRQQLDIEQRRAEKLSHNAEFAENLSKELQEKKEEKAVIQKMLERTRSEFKNLKEQVQIQRLLENPKPQSTGIPLHGNDSQNDFEKSTVLDYTSSFPEAVFGSNNTIIPGLEDNGSASLTGIPGSTTGSRKSTKIKNLVIPHQSIESGQPISPRAVYRSQDHSEFSDTGSGMKRPETVNTDNTDH